MSINNEKIAEIMQKSPTAEAFATYAACRERNVRDGISRLSAIRAQMAKEGFSPIPQDLLVMFRELERAGIGRLNGNQFKWSVPIKSVGTALEPVKAPAPKSPAPSKTSRTLVVCFDKNKEVSIEFTPTITKEEVEFLCSRLLQECKG